jgi:predicted metalloenzyme YecM
LHARYTQEIAAIGAIASKALVNGRSIEVVNIPSTKMMKEFFASREFVRPRNYGRRLPLRA